MAISIDWITKVISIPQADLTPLGGANYELDTVQFHWDLRDLMDDEAGMVFLPTHTWVASVTLAGFDYAPLFEIINGYTITFENGNYRVFLAGSNSNIMDVTNLNNVAIASQNSAGLVQQEEVKHLAFNSGIWIDTVGGAPGVAYPLGTERYPVDNLPDALTILVARNFHTLNIIGNLTVLSGQDVSDLQIIGHNATRSVLTFNTSSIADNTEVINASVTGDLDNDVILRDCYITGLTVKSGFLFQCKIHGTLTLESSGSLQVLSCYSDEELTVDMGGSTNNVFMQDHHGELRLTNKTGTNKAEIHISSGGIIVAASVTDVTGIHLDGLGNLDNQTGLTIDSHLLDPDAIWAELLEGTLSAAEMMRVMMAALSGRTTGLGTDTEHYKSVDNLKTRIEATFDVDSNRTSVALDGSV